MKSRSDDSRGKGSATRPQSPPLQGAGVNPRPNARALRWFRVIGAISPLFLLGLLEMGLRLAGFGYPTSFFIRTSHDGKRVLIENRQFGWRFFPPALARTPQPLTLATPKAPNTLRIFVFGESAAMGDPEPAYGFGRQLEKMLQVRHPERQIEVVNVAMTAINSHVIREIARDCAKAEGDCWLIYAGNNEVVGPYGAGTVFGRQAPPLGVVRLNLLVKRTRIGQWAARLLSRGGKTGEWQGMEMFLQQQVKRNDPRLTRVYQSFGANLGDIAEYGRRAGAKVLMATVPVNLKDCPPFGSEHRPGLSNLQTFQWEQYFVAGREAQKQKNYTEAVKAYEEAAKIDAEPAELIFHLAECELRQGESATAKADYARARDLDTLRFRADSALNEAVRQVAISRNIRLVDVDKEWSEAAANPVPGDDLFHDHVHPNFTGNYRLATLFLWEVEHALFGASTNSTPLLSEQEVAHRLAFTEYDRRRVLEEIRVRLQQPPFSTQSSFKERDERLGRLLQEMKGDPRDSLATYREAIAHATNDWVLHANVARALEAAGQATTAASEWQQVTRLAPDEADAWFQLGNLAHSAGAYAEAERCFKEALKRKPESTEALNGLALSVSAQGQTAEAKRLYETALKLAPHFASARINLAVLLAQSGDIPAATAEYQRVLSLDRSNVAARINLGQLLYRQGNLAEAVVWYQQAVELKPDNAIAQYDLGNALSAQKKYSEAIDHYRAAVKARPDFADARYNLGLELARMGRIEEALSELAEVVHLKPDFADGHFNYGIALARERRYSDAVREFQETLRLNPQHETARASLQRALTLSEQKSSSAK